MVTGKERNTLKMQVQKSAWHRHGCPVFGDIRQILTYIMQKYGESKQKNVSRGGKMQ